MSGSILPFEGRRHAEAQRLLPWLLTGQLDDDERAWLQPHVADCVECRRELEELRALREACAQADDGMPDDASATTSAADRGWRRLRPLLQPSRTLRDQAWRRAPGRRPRWLGWAIAAQAATLAALAFVLLQPPAPARYRTLGAMSPVPAGNLVIAFDPRLDETHLRHLLLASQARIVDGPNDAGAYVLAVAPARLPMVRDALRAAPGVTLVATLGPGSAQ